MTREEYIGYLDEDHAPVVDMAQEVVRCRDCRFFGEDELGAFCTWFDFEDVDEERQREGFCSWAKRRDA